MSGWPTRKQYVAAIQKAPQSFVDPSLATATFASDMLGMPLVSSGQTALVFKANSEGLDQAVRLFTGGTSNGRDRYRELALHLKACNIRSVADAEWHEHAIRVGDELHPLVTMEWVVGDGLHLAVERRLQDAPRLRHLAQVWRYQLAELRSGRVAHGDLQHGNIILDPAEQFRFIDLDGVWVPRIAAHPPSEFGQPNYQHPDRTNGQVWGEHIDWFSGLVIYVSLRALSADPSLWRHHHGDNLIFRDTDFRGDTEIWHELGQSPDSEVSALSDILANCCTSDPLAMTDLEEVLRNATAPSPPPSKTAQAHQQPSWGHQDAPQSEQWWRDDATSTTSSSPGQHQSATTPGERQKPHREQVHSEWDPSQPPPPRPSAADSPPPPGPLPGPGVQSGFAQPGMNLPPPMGFSNNEPHGRSSFEEPAESSVFPRLAMASIAAGAGVFASSGNTANLGIALILAAIFAVVGALQS